MELWGGFKKEIDKETGRELTRITAGAAFCYPMYYFIPSITNDGAVHGISPDEFKRTANLFY